MISSVIIENDSVVKGEVPEKPGLTEYRTRRRMEDDYESGIRKIIKML